MKKQFSLYIAFLVTLTALTFMIPAPSNAQETDSAKTSRLLKESKFASNKIADGVWVVPFKGKELADFNVMIGADKGILVMFVNLTNKQRYTKSPELLTKLLVQNDNMDRVKIGLNNDGDIVVGLDQTLRIVDQREFEEILDQLGAATDKVFGIIKPYMGKAT